MTQRRTARPRSGQEGKPREVNTEYGATTSPEANANYGGDQRDREAKQSIW